MSGYKDFRPRSNPIKVNTRWMEDAECANSNSDVFFYNGASILGSPQDPKFQEAKAICRRCPVRLECLEWAFLTHSHVGVWGGLLPRQRRELFAIWRREGYESDPEFLFRVGRPGAYVP